PQLDLRALYRTSGLESRLDDSLNQMAEFNYTDWTLGLEFSVPLDNRRGKADVESAELQLMRELALLRGFEEQVVFEFANLIAELQTTWERYESALRQVQYTQEWLRLARIRFASPPAANRGDDWLLLALYDYQVAMQSYITASTTASEMLAAYNTLQVRVEEAQGTLLDRWQIGFVDGSKANGPPMVPILNDAGGHSTGP
ncbi:MAG: TolC family protein, partial [Planctomycetaceae bacterium]|nr:TolC family protein [Planctomycetaceae bacterium]